MKQLPEVNQDIRSRLKDITCFALDMDGTVYLGTKWIEGAVDFLKAVEKAGKQYIFLTNNSSKGPENYVEKLAAMGLIVTKEHTPWRKCVALDISAPPAARRCCTVAACSL